MSLKPIGNNLVLVLPVITPVEWGDLPHGWWLCVIVDGNGGWESMSHHPTKAQAQNKAREVRRNIRRQLREQAARKRGPRAKGHHNG